MGKHVRLLLMGPPGGGKGTVGKMMSKRLVIPTLSTGDALRAQLANGGRDGQAAAAAIKGGALVDDATMSRLLKGLLEAQSNGW